MENISENPQRKRGRPCKIPEWERRLAHEGRTAGRSPRQQNNDIYQTRALAQLMQDPGQRFGWLCSDESAVMRGEGRMRNTLLSELGRIDNEQTREMLALMLCETQPTTREALRVLRRVRLQRVPLGNRWQLAEVIRRAIHTYLGEHERLPWADVRQALYEVLADVDATEDKEERRRTAAPVG
jgi:hypothetical protein